MRPRNTFVRAARHGRSCAQPPLPSSGSICSTRQQATSGRPVIFGRGANPINFVSVSDVAALVERAVVDPSTRGATFEIGGPQNLSFNELAAGVATGVGAHGDGAARSSRDPAPPRGRAPTRPAESCASDSCGHRDGQHRFDLHAPTDLHRRFPELPVTSLADILARRQVEALVPASMGREIAVASDGDDR